MGSIAKAIHVGVDVGQRQDPSAVCVAELQEQGTVRDSVGQVVERGRIHYVIRYLQRLPLGTPYPAVADRLIDICDKLEERQKTIRIYLDATGVGQPLVDMFRERSRRWAVTHMIIGHGARTLIPVYLTGSERATFEDGELKLGKAAMVNQLRLLYEEDLIDLPPGAETDALLQELLTYEIRVNENAHAQFGAFKTGAHDDLVTALGLACWHGPRGGRRKAWAKALW